jgi:hypothetical protein
LAGSRLLPEPQIFSPGSRGLSCSDYCCQSLPMQCSKSLSTEEAKKERASSLSWCIVVTGKVSIEGRVCRQRESFVERSCLSFPEAMYSSPSYTRCSHARIISSLLIPCEQVDRRGTAEGFARGLRGRWQGAPVGSTGIALAPDRAPKYCKLYHDPAQHSEEMACGAVIHFEKTEGICVSECLRGCLGGWFVRARELLRPCQLIVRLVEQCKIRLS